MTRTLHHEIEIADESATLYLSGTLDADDAFTLSRICSDIPKCVTTLRLDLHGVSQMEGNAMVAVRGVLRYWRESRGGSFRLSLASERIVATCAEGNFVPPSLALRTKSRAGEAVPSLTAMYL